MVRITRIVWLEYIRAFRVFLVVDWDQWNQLRDNLIRIKPDGRITQHPNPFEDQTWLLLETQMDRRELDELIAIYNSWDPLEKELDLIMGVGQ